MESLMILAESGANSSSLSSVASEIFSIASSALQIVTSNSILLVFFGAGIVGIAIGAVSKLKHS